MGTVANVVDGQIQISETSQTEERSTGSSLGKEDFLMLLVTQMQYQDPLDPADNTEYVSQLAQFSELEAMQNLSDTTTNTSAFTLVGKEVYIEDKSESGYTTSAQGIVEYVTIQNGDPYVSVNGELYSYDSIVQVIDESYLVSLYLPSIDTQTVTYRHHDPQNVTVSGIDLGSEGYEATSFAVAIVSESGETSAIDVSKLSYSKGSLVIDKSAFADLDAGTYQLVFVFDDANTTVNYDSVTLEVKGIKPTN